MSRPIKRQKVNTCLQVFHDAIITALNVIKNRYFYVSSALTGPKSTTETLEQWRCSGVFF